MSIIDKLQFNLSPSAINLYKKDQLQFYFNYIVKEIPDTECNKVYGISGNVVHDVLEETAKQNLSENKAIENFNTKWFENNLNTTPSLNGKPLNKDLYQNAVNVGLKHLENKYEFVRAEESISFPLINDSRATIKLKGIIDLQCKEGDDFVIVDWKTSSKIDDSEDFKRQLKHYCLLVYKKYGIVPKSCYVEYVKINKTKAYSFTEQQLIDYEQQVLTLAEDIIDKGHNIKNYSFNEEELNSPFNAHKKKISKEINKRMKQNVIQCCILNNKLYFLSKLPDTLRKAMNLKYSYYKEGYQFSEAFQRRQWDGKKYLMKKDYIPFAFIRDFQKMLIDYNNFYNTNYSLNIEDRRDEKVLNKKFNTNFKEAPFNLRYYQKQAVDVANRKMIGIINIGTGLGKTAIACELIKKLNRRTLFLVDRIELVRQTKENLEQYLGVEIGEMSEGNIDISHQITVASIQTISAILKRNNEDSERLKRYLYNITVCVSDEVQRVKDEGIYGIVSSYIVNCLYSIGLTGTPWRNDGSTLEMNAFCGFPIYNKTTKEGENEGYLCPTKCYFIKPDLPSEEPEMLDNSSYNDMYDAMITHNDNRNNLIKNLVEHFDKTNKKIMVITKKIEHAKKLEKLIPNSFVITSKTNANKRKQMYEQFKEKGGFVLIGGIKIFSAGIDIPDLDVAINTTAHKSDGDTIQLIGRTKRKIENKTHGYYIDLDDQHSYFRGAAKRRKKILKQFNNEVFEINDIKEIK